jgi:CBS-domain-containing membrane protein
MSHIIASSHPPPSAKPLTAAMVGVRVAANSCQPPRKPVVATSANVLDCRVRR